MTSVGSILRTERERQGRDVADIADSLCITPRYVRAIEQDDFESLPGSFFYKSFVKQYAAILGVDAARLQPGIEALTSPVEPLPLPGADFRHSAPREAPVRELDPIVRDGNRHYIPDRRIGVSLTGLVLMVLACSGFYAWWNKPAGAIAKAPLRVDARSAVAQTAMPGSPSPGLDVTTTTGPDGVNHVVLNLSATEKTWLSITSDGKEVFSGILEPSQTKTLTGLDVAKMRVGNAGGLDVRWNGKSIGPIGPRGQVRVILFTPENFQILTPNTTL
ncbi:MAG TPA: RodZ domain-containing protein [Bryobacteraceae bacterium]|nr:RodZ domain-containing protein [Bryobacteraceae bacterium]